MPHVHMPSRPILVTGAAGFIGSHLTERLTTMGRRVVGLDDLCESYDPQLKRRNLAPLLAGDHWQRRAVAAIIEDLYSQQRALCRTVLSDGAHSAPEDAVENWITQNQEVFERAAALFDDLKSAGPLDLSKLALANRHLRELILA